MKRPAAIVLLGCVLAVANVFPAGKPAPALSYPKGNGLRILATGHSWVAPAMKTLGPIALAAGLDGHRLRSHLNGGSKGSARSIWAAEHGREYPGRPEGTTQKTILLPAIDTGQWDVMTWGSYTWDAPEDYTRWIDVCLKSNPAMIFYIQDYWPRAHHGMVAPDTYDIAKFIETQRQTNAAFKELVAGLNARYPGKIRIIPVGDGICALLQLLLDKQLPHIQKVDSKKQAIPGIYSDGGHLDENSGMHWFEGYVYYATLYKRSPELIQTRFNVPNDELDQVFRKIAWQVVTRHPLSGVTDRDGNGLGDKTE